MGKADSRRTLELPLGIVGADEKRKRRCARLTEAFQKRAEGSERRWLAGLGAKPKQVGSAPARRPPRVLARVPGQGAANADL